MKWQKRTQNSGAISLQIKIKVFRVTSQVRMYCADKALKQWNCQGHNRTATFSVQEEWTYSSKEEPKSSWAEYLKPGFLQLSSMWLSRNSQEFLLQPSQNRKIPSHTSPTASNSLPFFSKLLKNDWSSVTFYLLLASHVESTSSADREHLFCHWSTFAAQIPLVWLAGKRWAHAHTGAWVWTEAFQKQSSMLFLGHKSALWLLPCKTGPGGHLWRMIAVQTLQVFPKLGVAQV